VGQTLLLLLLAVTLGGPARAQGTARNQADREIENEILKIEHEKDEAMQKGDVATLDRIYADDLTFVNTRGQVATKAERLADLRPGNLEYLSFRRGDYRLHIYGNTVVLTGRSRSVVEYHRKVVRTPRQFMQVYIKQGGQWQLVAHQATFVAE
jgi:hypothetical protein